MNHDVEQEVVSRRLETFAAPDIPDESPIQSEKRRQRVVSRLQMVAAQAKHRKRIKNKVFAGSLTALATAATLALWYRPQPSKVPQPRDDFATVILNVKGRAAEVTSSTGVANIEPGRPARLRELQRISTHSESTAQIDVPGPTPKVGIQIGIGPSSELTLAHSPNADGIERIDLIQGSVQVEVEKLQAGGSFMLVTPSIRAIVVGTAFNVAVGPHDPQDTCVRVSEGIVRVEELEAPHAEIAMIAAGGSWGCEQKPLNSQKNSNEVRRAPVEKRQDTRQAPPAARPTSTLAEESALFALAVRHNQEENFSAAVQDLDTLLLRYPKSALASEAIRLRSELRETARRKAKKPAAKAAPKPNQ